MDETEVAEPSPADEAAKKYLSVRQAAFIGVGAMLGAGMFALLGAAAVTLVLAIVAAGAVFVTFVFTTLIHEPASIVTIAVIVVLSVGLDYGWKCSRPSRPVPVQVGP